MFQSGGYRRQAEQIIATVQVVHESVHGIKWADRDLGYGLLAGAKRTIASDRDLLIRAAEQNPRALVARDGFS
jgi:hypothetical protein